VSHSAMSHNTTMNGRNTSDLGSLMPHTLAGPQGRDSPVGTIEIRQYMNVRSLFLGRTLSDWVS